MHNVTISTRHGAMCVNRNDEHAGRQGIGVELMQTGEYAPAKMSFLRSVLPLLPIDGVFLDVGANLGVVSLECARHFSAGQVHAFEAQHQIFLQLAANVALNSLDHVFPHYLVISDQGGNMDVPQLNPDQPARFASLELGHEQIEEIGQWPPDCSTLSVPMRSLDSLQSLPPPSLVKVDVEGMELKVIDGAQAMLLTHRPLLFVDFGKTDIDALIRRVKALRYDAYLHQPSSTLLFVPSERMKVNGLPQL